MDDGLPDRWGRDGFWPSDVDECDDLRLSSTWSFSTNHDNGRQKYNISITNMKLRPVTFWVKMLWFSILSYQLPYQKPTRKEEFGCHGCLNLVSTMANNCTFYRVSQKKVYTCIMAYHFHMKVNIQT